MAACSWLPWLWLLSSLAVASMDIHKSADECILDADETWVCDEDAVHLLQVSATINHRAGAKKYNKAKAVKSSEGADDATPSSSSGEVPHATLSETLAGATSQVASDVAEDLVELAEDAEAVSVGLPALAEQQVAATLQSADDKIAEVEASVASGVSELAKDAKVVEDLTVEVGLPVLTGHGLAASVANAAPDFAKVMAQTPEPAVHPPAAEGEPIVTDTQPLQQPSHQEQQVQQQPQQEQEQPQQQQEQEQQQAPQIPLPRKASSQQEEFQGVAFAFVTLCFMGVTWVFTCSGPGDAKSSFSRALHLPVASDRKAVP